MKKDQKAVEALSPRKRRFIQEFVRTPIGSKAAIAAGYSARGASRAANRLLGDPVIANEVKRLNGEVARGAGVDATWWLDHAVELHERCMQEIKPVVDKKGNQVKDEAGNFLFVFDAANASRSLELIGKHIGAFKDTSEEGKAVGAPLPIALVQFIVNNTERVGKSADA